MTRDAKIWAGMFLVLTSCSAQPPTTKSLAPASEGSLSSISWVDSDQLRNSFGTNLPAFTTKAADKDTISRLNQAFQSIEAFPKNTFSGCHARAHHVFNVLERIAPGVSYKIWVFAGGLYAPMLSGDIRPAKDATGEVKWDYHVATAFNDETGAKWVADPTFSERPMPLSEWLGHMVKSPGTIGFATPGSYYLFNLSQVSTYALNDGFLHRNVMNGNFYEYDRLAASNHLAATDLAVDRVSTELVSGKYDDCEWRAAYRDSMTLLKAIQAANVSNECLPLKEFFHSEREFWIERGL